MDPSSVNRPFPCVLVQSSSWLDGLHQTRLLAYVSSCSCPVVPCGLDSGDVLVSGSRSSVDGLYRFIQFGEFSYPFLAFLRTVITYG
jgi:hypothetical protein